MRSTHQLISRYPKCGADGSFLILLSASGAQLFKQTAARKMPERFYRDEQRQGRLKGIFLCEGIVLFRMTGAAAKTTATAGSDSVLTKNDGNYRDQSKNARKSSSEATVLLDGRRLTVRALMQLSRFVALACVFHSHLPSSCLFFCWKIIHWENNLIE